MIPDNKKYILIILLDCQRAPQDFSNIAPIQFWNKSKTYQEDG